MKINCIDSKGRVIEREMTAAEIAEYEAQAEHLKQAEQQKSEE